MIGGYLCLLIGWSGSATAQQDEQASRSQPAESVYQQVLDQLTQLTPSAEVGLQMEADRVNYPFETEMELRFVVDQDGYVLLMRIAPDGAITFPLPEQPVLGGQVYSTGDAVGTVSSDTMAQSLGLGLIAGTKRGSEVFNLVYSPEKLDWFSGDFAHDPAYTITPTDEERLQLLLTRVAELSQTPWSGTSVSVLIGPMLKNAVPRKYGAIPPIHATGSAGKEKTLDDVRGGRRKLWTSPGEN